MLRSSARSFRLTLRQLTGLDCPRLAPLPGGGGGTPTRRLRLRSAFLPACSQAVPREGRFLLLLLSFSDLSLQHLLLPFAPFSHSATFPFFFSLLSVRPACLSFRLCHLERCCHCPHCPGFSVMVNMQDYSSLFRHRLGASQFTSIIVTSYSGDESIIVFIFEMKKKNAF